MNNFLRIAQGIDVSKLALELHQNPQLWNQNPERLGASGPHYDTDDIWIRANDRTEADRTGDWSTFNDVHESKWYEGFYALPAVRKIVFDLARFVEAEQIGDILIWRVRPGKQIQPHTDRSWHVDYYDKFNVCIQSAPGAEFRYDGEQMEERPGEVHRFVNTVDHSVVNNSRVDYIVMVVCLRVHDYARRYKA